MTTNPQYWALVLFGLVGCATVTSNGVRPTSWRAWMDTAEDRRRWRGA